MTNWTRGLAAMLFLTAAAAFPLGCSENVDPRLTRLPGYPVYRKYCKRCHGADGAASKASPPPPFATAPPWKRWSG